jgi:triosephosphate isomerase
VLLGAQDCYFEKSGAFTGEISVEMLRDLNVAFCLTGHSERRHVLHEPPMLIEQKARAVYRDG